MMQPGELNQTVTAPDSENLVGCVHGAISPFSLAADFTDDAAEIRGLGLCICGYGHIWATGSLQSV